jgi:FkbM family methyltransferase
MIALRIKTFVADLICRPVIGRLFGRVFNDRIPAGGCVIDTASPAVSASTRAMLFWRIYESAEARFVRRYLRPDLNVVELGASLGFVSSLVRQRLDANRQLVCVEANAALLPLIRRNLDRNAPGKSSELINAGIYYGPSSDGTVAINLGDTTMTSTVGETGLRRVAASRLSAILADQRLRDYALIADIEGAEAGLIVEEREALALCQQVIIELHDTTYAGEAYSVQRLRDSLRDRHGFSLVAQYGSVCVFERSQSDVASATA